MPLRPPSIRFAFAAAALLFAATAALPVEAFAQDRSWPPQYRRDRPQFALEASGALSQLSGNALGPANDGSGFDVMGSIGVSVLSLGGGYQRSTHRLGAGDAIVQGVFFEPRIALPLVARNFTPFVYGRVARLERTSPAELGSDVATGTGVGAGLGTYVWLAPNVQLNTTVGWTDLRFSEGNAVGGSSFVGRANGSSWGVRAGLTLGFDRWGR